MTKLGKPWGLAASTATLVIINLVMAWSSGMRALPCISISVTLVMLGYYYIDALFGWRSAVNRTGEVLDHWKQCRDEMAPLIDELGRETRRASAPPSVPEGTDS